MTQPHASDRVSTEVAAKILGVEAHHIRGFAKRGLLSAIRLPGVRVKYLRSEVEALAKSSVHREIAATEQN